MSQEVFSGVRAMVAKKSGIKPESLLLDHRLLQDLGIDGDDAVELMDSIARRFQIDMAGFEFEAHFRSEPLLFSIFHRRSRVLQEIALKVPLTVRDLQEAADGRTWVRRPNRDARSAR